MVLCKTILNLTLQCIFLTLKGPSSFMAPCLNVRVIEDRSFLLRSLLIPAHNAAARSLAFCAYKLERRLYNLSEILGISQLEFFLQGNILKQFLFWFHKFSFSNFCPQSLSNELAFGEEEKKRRGKKSFLKFHAGEIPVGMSPHVSMSNLIRLCFLLLNDSTGLTSPRS